MSKDISSYISQKVDTQAPAREQIIALEEREATRVQHELSTMAEEVKKLEDSLAATEAATEAQDREVARTALKHYREHDLAKVLKDAEAQAEKRSKELHQSYDQAAQAVVTKLVHTMTEFDSSDAA
jgi:Skp family chaperone for outer membrane proteins